MIYKFITPCLDKVLSFMSNESCQLIWEGRPPTRINCVMREEVDETGLNAGNSLPDGCNSFILKTIVRIGNERDPYLKGFATLALNIKFSIGAGFVESKVTSSTETSLLSGIIFSPRTRMTLTPSSSTIVLVVEEAWKSARLTLIPVKAATSGGVGQTAIWGLAWLVMADTEGADGLISSRVGCLKNLLELH